MGFSRKEKTFGDGTPKDGRSRFSRLLRSRDGAAAIEFAILAIPYFMIIFATLETFVAFWGEQVVANAVATISRDLRTGQITFNLDRDTDMTEEEFRAEFCDRISVLMKCSATEALSPAQLYLDVRSFSNFSNIPTSIPRVSSDKFADIDPSSMQFNPGGPGTINMVRAYYRWKVVTDLLRPYLTTIRPSDGSMPTDFLIIETTAFMNEEYP